MAKVLCYSYCVLKSKYGWTELTRDLAWNVFSKLLDVSPVAFYLSILTFNSPVFSLKGFQCHGSCTRSCTVWLRSPSAATASSAPSCCSSSCSSLSSSPLHPASGRWTRCWAPPCSCSTLSSWSSAWCWRIASLLAPFPSESQKLSPPQTSCETGSRTVNSHQPYLSWALLWISVETVWKAIVVTLICCHLFWWHKQYFQDFFFSTFLVKMAAFYSFLYPKWDAKVYTRGYESTWLTLTTSS